MNLRSGFIVRQGLVSLPSHFSVNNPAYFVFGSSSWSGHDSSGNKVQYDNYTSPAFYGILRWVRIGTYQFNGVKWRLGVYTYGGGGGGGSHLAETLEATGVGSAAGTWQYAYFKGANRVMIEPGTVYNFAVMATGGRVGYKGAGSYRFRWYSRNYALGLPSDLSAGAQISANLRIQIAADYIFLADIPCSFEVGQNKRDLAASFEVRRDGSEELLGGFVSRQPGPMEQVIFGGFNTDALDPNATEYNSLAGGNLWSADETGHYQLVSTDGVIKWLRARLFDKPGVGNKYTFTLMLNGNPTALTFDIIDNEIFGSNMVDEVAVTGGDYVYLRCVPFSVPSARTATWTCVFKGDNPRESLILGRSPDDTNPAATEYAQVMGSETIYSNVENDFRQIVPTAGTIKNFYVKLSEDPGTDPDAYRLTLRKGGASQTLTVTITADATTGNDLVNSFTVAAGDVFTLMIEPLNVPTATPKVAWGMTFAPDINGESIVLGGAKDDLHGAATEYNRLLGAENSLWGNENQRYQLGQVCIVKKLHVLLTAAPGGATSRLFVIRKGLVPIDSNVQVLIAGADTTGDSGALQDTIALNERTAFRHTPVGAVVAADAYWGFVCYIAPLFDDSVDLPAKFEVQDSEDLFAKFEVAQGSEDLLAEFISRQVGSQDLLSEFEVRRDGSRELSAKFEVRQDGSQDLFAEFDVRQPGSQGLSAELIVRQLGSQDLPAEFIVRRDGSKDLGASFDGQVSLNLPAEFTVRRDGSQELSSEFEVRRDGSQELLATFSVQIFTDDSEDLLAEFITRRDDSEDLLAKFTVRQPDSQDLLGEFISRQAGSKELGASFDAQVSLNLPAEFTVKHDGSQELFAEFDVRHDSSQELLAELVVRQSGSQDLLAEFVSRQLGSQELLGEFVIRRDASQELAAGFISRQAGSQDLAASFDGQVSLNLPAEFISRQSGSQNLLAELISRQADSEELPAEFISRQADSQDLAASFDAQVSLNLPAEFTVRRDTSQELLGEFISRQAGSQELLGELVVRRDASQELGASFDAQVSLNLPAKFTVRRDGSQELLGELVIRRDGSHELLGEFDVRRDGSQEVLAEFIIRRDGDQDLPAKFISRQAGSQDLLSEFIVRHPRSEDLKSTFQVGQGSTDLLAKFTVRRSDTGELSARFAIRLPWPLWTNRYWLNGVVQLDEAKIPDSFLEEIITGVMDDIKTWLIAEEIGQYSGWTNIDVTPRAIRRAATYGTVASLYARNIFGPQDLVIRVAPMDAKIFTSSEAAMEYWEAMMLRVLELYLSGVGLLRIWIDTIDEDPVFTMEDIPLYTWSPDDGP